MIAWIHYGLALSIAGGILIGEGIVHLLQWVTRRCWP
jgi:hypothetical protein